MDSNISSSVFNSRAQYQNAHELDDLDEDEEDGWTKVEKISQRTREVRKPQPSISMMSNLSTSTVVTERFNDDDSSVRNSSTRSFRGRGKPLNWNKS